MSFPGGDSRAETSGAEEEGGKTGEEIAPSGSVFAVLQAYATHVFAPAVRAYAAARGGDDKASAPISACFVAGKGVTVVVGDVLLVLCVQFFFS